MRKYLNIVCRWRWCWCWCCSLVECACLTSLSQLTCYRIFSLISLWVDTHTYILHANIYFDVLFSLWWLNWRASSMSIQFSQISAKSCHPKGMTIEWAIMFVYTRDTTRELPKWTEKVWNKVNWNVHTIQILLAIFITSHRQHFSIHVHWIHVTIAVSIYWIEQKRNHNRNTA